MAEFWRKLSEVNGNQGEEEFGFFGLRLPGGEPATLHRASAALTGLLMIVDGADAAPSADAQRAAEQWETAAADMVAPSDRNSTRLNSSHHIISYASSS